MCKIVGPAVAERLLITAKLLQPKEALDIGLVDEVVPKSLLLESAVAEMKKMLKTPDNGRHETKKTLRLAFAQEWSAAASSEAISGWSFLSDPNTVRFLGKVLEKLSKGTSKM